MSNKQKIQQEVYSNIKMNNKQKIQQADYSIIKTSDLFGLSLSIGYEIGMDYNKLDLMMMAEKTSYNVLGKILQPVLSDFTPNFLKKEGKFFNDSDNQKHLTRGVVSGIYNYYIKNNSYKKSMIEGVVEGVSSLIGDKLMESFSKNPNIELEDEMIF